MIQEPISLARARDEVCKVLRSQILDGRLGGDQRIAEVELAEALGVSRTPVREALILLEDQGLIRSRPHRGYQAVTADAELVRETYPVLGGLETAALRQGFERLVPAVPALRRINEALAGEPRRTRQYELDRRFHEGLTAHCANPRLLALLAQERVRAARFDGAHDRGMAALEKSCVEHSAVLDAIEAGDRDGAAALLTAHWDGGVEVVIGWLRQRGRP
jgi:DNA-binding GntR family transcriptional regulator